MGDCDKVWLVKEIAPQKGHTMKGVTKMKKSFEEMNMKELRAWAKENGYQAKARSKAELMARLGREMEEKIFATKETVNPVKATKPVKAAVNVSGMTVNEMKETLESGKDMSIKDLRGWIKANNFSSKARSKEELKARLLKEIGNTETRKKEARKSTSIGMDNMKDNYDAIPKADTKSIPSFEEETKVSDYSNLSKEDVISICKDRQVMTFRTYDDYTKSYLVFLLENQDQAA